MAKSLNLKERIQKILELQQKNSTELPASKFRSIKPDILEVKEYLSMRYKNLVESRGKSILWNEQTLAAIDYVALWLFTPQRDGLLLYGKYGNGKTTLMTCLRDLFSKDRYSDRLLFTTPAMIIRDMNKPPSDNSLYNHCCNVDVLLLDEVGAEDKTAVVWGNRCTPLQDILVYRYDRRRITVLSSNCDNGELLDRYGERVMDRIRESYTRVLFSHESYRTIE